jgi:hypothetical protein
MGKTASINAGVRVREQIAGRHPKAALQMAKDLRSEFHSQHGEYAMRLESVEGSAEAW